jgi:hypothetical protein
MTRANKNVKRNNDVLVISGDGKLLVEDLAFIDSFNVDYDIMAIGKSVRAHKKVIDHYVDIDAEEGKWVAENLQTIYPLNVLDNKIVRHTLGDVEWFDTAWDLVGNPWPSEDVMWHGSTSFFALLVALEMQYERIILAGCPLDSKGHWCFPNETWGPKWTGETYQVWFEFALDPRAAHVRSCSGYTKILLKEPDRGFLNGFSKGATAN